VNIVEPYARILNINGSTNLQSGGETALKVIEWCGRISHRSEETQTTDSWKRFIPAVVMGHGDWSIVEHASATVDMLVDRGITHEIVRHRLFSFTQESTRFVNYEKKLAPSFIRPESLNDSHSDGGSNTELAARAWYKAIYACEDAYQRIINCGSAPQIARSVFPNALASRILITGNLRNWRHFLLMRTTKEAHPQMRQVTIPLLAEFKTNVPLLFDDITPNSRQADNLRLPR
jgi:thymidylate synthase (FAD)